jgi:hypothetical protein
MTAWATYQSLVREVSVWPFNADIIRRLATSIFFPVVVFIAKVFSPLGIYLD